MFVRQKRNRSGSVSVQVIDKTNGYRVIKTMGSSRHPEEIERFVELGKAYIARQSQQYSLSPYDHRFVHTPHFDCVARDGVRFDAMFTTNPKCAPSRASLLTGRHTWQLGEALHQLRPLTHQGSHSRTQ
jgi:arylsulfatase A-like enzyme